MDKKLAQKAVQTALSGDWESAITLNKKILKSHPDDVDALNRLARAYAETGKVDKAIKTGKKVLKLDPFNTIAEKSLTKWGSLEEGETIKSGPTNVQTFLEEPGKTKIVPLINLGDKKILNQLDSADEVVLKAHNHRVCIYTLDDKYLGRLPDDVAARLRKLIKYGNEYKAYVKSANQDNVHVFIKETIRSDKLKDVPSFSTEKIDYISFTPPELVHDKSDIVTQTDDEDE